MALNPTSAKWKTASSENRDQRNVLRDAFFAQSGIKPATSLRNIFLDHKARKSQFEKALTMASENRIGDSHLTAINDAANIAYQITGLGVPSLMGNFDTRPLGILAMSPEVLKAFFEVDHDTALERSMTD